LNRCRWYEEIAADLLLLSICCIFFRGRTLIWLLRDFDLLSVFVRALTLGLELLTLGGIAYLLFCALSARAGESVTGGCWRGIRWAAASFAIVELCYITVDSAILLGSSSLPIGDLVGAHYFLGGFAIVMCAWEG
jgi:putative copper resistance protein D